MTRKTLIQPAAFTATAGAAAGKHATYSAASPSEGRRPSKSQLKRDMHALQALGKALVALPKDVLHRVPMPEPLNDAVQAARRITDHEGQRRQIQYIGRVMRSLSDGETAQLRAALDGHHGVSKAQTARLHWIEHTRSQLLASDDALTLFLHAYPSANAQEGRLLIRQARKEAQQNKPPRYFRALFQWIKVETSQAHTDDSTHTLTPE